MKRTSIVDTPAPGEIIAVFDNDGTPRNVTVTDEALQASLRETPATLPNPAYAVITDKVFAAAEAQVAAAAKKAEELKNAEVIEVPEGE